MMMTLRRKRSKRINYQTNIYLCLAEIEETLEKVQGSTGDLVYRRPLESRHSFSRSSSPEPHSSGGNFMRLPKITIQPFDGNPLHYQTFMDSFESSINSNNRLNDVDKFLYLKGLLKGKALNTIEGLTLTADNYKEAMKLLQSRFGDKKLLIATFFDSLLNLSPVKEDTSNIAKLRDLYDSVESNVRNLKSLGVTSESFGPVLIPTVLNKIPESIRLEVTKTTRTQDWDFDGVLKCFHDELTAREQCKFVAKSTSSSSRRSSYNTEISGASLHASIREKSDPCCVYCNEPHKPWRCHNVTDITSRREILRESNRCYNCLKKEHSSHECNSRYKCFHCRKKHNSSLCPREKSGRRDQTDGRNRVHEGNLVNERNHIISHQPLMQVMTQTWLCLKQLIVKCLQLRPI